MSSYKSMHALKHADIDECALRVSGELLCTCMYISTCHEA